MLRVDSFLSLSNAAAAAAAAATATTGQSAEGTLATQSELASDLLKRGEFDQISEAPTELEQQRFQRNVEDRLIDRLRSSGSKAFHLSDILSYVHQGMQTVINDDFSKCFQSHPRDAWNFNFYLWPLWALGVLFRYSILFPIRLVGLLVGVILMIIVLLTLPLILRDKATLARYQRLILRWLCGVFVMSWTGVIKYHVLFVVFLNIPVFQIYVSNHTSMIDLLVLQQANTFAVVGQKHKGWIAWMQDHVLGCLGCIWFDRAQVANRDATAKAIRDHIHNENSNRLLIFPEGTCVNNQYCVQFKKGAFELGAEVCPIAMKYNDIFVDAFWNSRSQSFGQHLFRLMTSWAVVCDVYYLEPQYQQPNESPIDFAARVKAMIAERACLKNVDFDGYLKHFKPSQRYVEERQKLFAQSLLKRFPQALTSPTNCSKEDSDNGTRNRKK